MGCGGWAAGDNPNRLWHLVNTQVDEILRGAYDLHVRAGPDLRHEPRLGVLEAARHAYESEMGGFVLRADGYVTAPLAEVISLTYPGLAVSGAVALSPAVGGLNPSAVEAAAELDARVVWMSTSDAGLHARRRGRGPELSLLDGARGLRAEVRQILDVIARRDMLLVSGGVPAEETLALFEEARSRGVERLLAADDGARSPDELRDMAALGAYVERAYGWLIPHRATRTLQDMASSIRDIGVSNCVVTSGLGEWADPTPAEGMRMAIAGLLNMGVSADDLSILVKSNPAALLGISSKSP